MQFSVYFFFTITRHNTDFFYLSTYLSIYILLDYPLSLERYNSLGPEACQLPAGRRSTQAHRLRDREQRAVRQDQRDEGYTDGDLQLYVSGGNTGPIRWDGDTAIDQFQLNNTINHLIKGFVLFFCLIIFLGFVDE